MTVDQIAWLAVILGGGLGASVFAAVVGYRTLLAERDEQVRVWVEQGFAVEPRHVVHWWARLRRRGCPACIAELEREVFP